MNVQKIVLRAMVVGSFALAQGMLPGALAKVIHVRMDGHDTSCNGTANAAASAAPNCAYSTLNKGYQSSSAGDTVAVHAGTYATWNGDTLRPDACAASGYQEMIGMTASTPSGTPGNPITIDMTVDGPSSVTIDGQGVRGRIFFFMKNVSYVTFKGGLFRNIVPLLPGDSVTCASYEGVVALRDTNSNIILDGLDINDTNGGDNAQNPIGVLVKGSNYVTLRNLKVKAGNTAGRAMYWPIYVYSAHPGMTGNVLENSEITLGTCGASGIFSDVHWQGQIASTIRNNLIHVPASVSGCSMRGMYYRDHGDGGVSTNINRIEGNVFWTEVPIDAWTQQQGIPDVPRLYFNNNTLINTGACGAFGVRFSGSSNSTVATGNICKGFARCFSYQSSCNGKLFHGNTAYQTCGGADIDSPTACYDTSHWTGETASLNTINVCCSGGICPSPGWSGSQCDPKIDVLNISRANGAPLLAPRPAPDPVVNRADVSYAPILDFLGRVRVGVPDTGSNEYGGTGPGPDILPPAPIGIVSPVNGATGVPLAALLTGSLATDITLPISYSFEVFTGSTCSGTPTQTSGWVGSNVWTTPSLLGLTQFSWHYRARDAVSPTPNVSSWSACASFTTIALDTTPPGSVPNLRRGDTTP